MDYLYSKVQDASFRVHTAYRRAFAEHLKKVAKALHDIEWVDSCDFGEGDENDAIEACVTSGAVLAQLIKDAKKAKAELEAGIISAETVRDEHA